MQLARKKSLRKNKRRRELQKKWNEKKRQKINLKYIESSESNEDSRIHSGSQQQIPIRKNETEPVPSTPKQQKKVYRNLPEETPLHKSKKRFKQTKLNFQINQITNSANSMNENSLFVSKLHKKPDKKKPKMAPLGTSTPLYPRKSRKISSSSSTDDIVNITDIEAPKQTIDNLNDSKNSHLRNKKIRKRRMSKLSQGTNKSIGSLSHLQTNVKTNQRPIRSMKNKNMRK